MSIIITFIMKGRTYENWSKYILVALVFCLVIVLLTSCVTVRKATYPPNYVYLDNEQVHEAMRDMAISINSLNEILKQPAPEPAEKNRIVIEELDRLKSATDGLATDAPLSSHRVISDNMGSFRARVAEAKRAASSDSPDYDLSGRLVAECLSCHVKNANHNSFF